MCFKLRNRAAGVILVNAAGCALLPSGAQTLSNKQVDYSVCWVFSLHFTQSMDTYPMMESHEKV